MERIIDSAESVYIDQNIASSESNKWTASKLSLNLLFKNDKVVMDNPLLVFQRFQNIISSHLIRTNVDERYFYRPELFAKDFYGSSDLWWLVLCSSGTISHQNFNRRRIKVFNPTDIEVLDSIRESTIKEQEKTVEIKDLTIFPVRI
jgi:hypothetical protein